MFLWSTYISIFHIRKHSQDLIHLQHHRLILHCWSFTTTSWPFTKKLWTWCVAKLTALQYQCLVARVSAVLMLVMQKRLFCAQVTTVRTAIIGTTLMERVEKAVFLGPLNFPVWCEGVVTIVLCVKRNTAVFTQDVESREIQKALVPSFSIS